MRRAVTGAAVFAIAWAGTAAAQSVTLRPVEASVLPGRVDSNSPVIWDRSHGRLEVHVLTSADGSPSRASGQYFTLLGAPTPISIEPWPGGGVWMEAVVRDVSGAWYGFYHNENPSPVCGGTKPYARIGAARSTDRGATWTDLGIILDLPPETMACNTTNTYFVGGVGDLSVLVDRRNRDLYLYFSQYGRDPRQQGVAVARLAWADRDEPAGKLMVWSHGVWLPGVEREDSDGRRRWVYPAATPLVQPAKPWHDRIRAADAFWGPSIHWNAALQEYVMLLNRAQDESFGQEGIYVSFSPTLEDPRAWSPPRKILDGGRWYPQVIGVEIGRGSDTWAGAVARFYMSGRSDHIIEFQPER